MAADDTASRKTISFQPHDAQGDFHEPDLKPEIITKMQEIFSSVINGAASELAIC
jgi:hypothetical protein